MSRDSMIPASTANLRLSGVHALPPPNVLSEELPLSSSAEQTIDTTRAAIRKILGEFDDRLLVVVGPCSIHDPKAAIEYAIKLKEAKERYAQDLLLVMRVYFEKPRTTVGWKGLINDPFLDESFQIDTGLRRARKLLCDLNDMGVPCGCEFLDPISPQYIAGLVSWGAIGARTTESQVHRELASGLSMPIGFKNGTDGTVKIAVDAVLSSAQPHHFLGVTDGGLAGVVRTTGNKECHVILRGGNGGPNYDADSIAKTKTSLIQAGLRTGLMVDCSHGNSSKDYRRQPIVASNLASQVAGGQKSIVGLMIESNLVEGNQKIINGKVERYGQSVTDACVSWDMTVPILDELSAAVRSRRG